MPYQPRPPETLLAALDAHGAPQGEDDRRLGRIIKDLELTPPSSELASAGLRYLDRHGASRERLGVLQFILLRTWLEKNVQFLAGEMTSALAGDVSNAHVDTLRSAHRAGITSLGERTLIELVHEMAASDRHRPEVRENLALLAAELGLEGPSRPAEPATAAGGMSATQAEDPRVPWPPDDLLHDRSPKAAGDLVWTAVDDLREAMHDCDHDSEEQRKQLAGATTGQLHVTLALYYTNYVGVESWRLGDFLASGSGWSAALVADGLEALGFATTAHLLRELLAGLPDPVPIPAEERVRKWAALESPSREASMSRLADQVSLLRDDDRLITAAAAYIRNHPDQFFVDAE